MSRRLVLRKLSPLLSRETILGVLFFLLCVSVLIFTDNASECGSLPTMGRNKKKVKNLKLVRTNSGIDRVISDQSDNDSEPSSLFSTEGDSEYNPYSDSGDYTGSEVISDEDDNGESLLEFVDPTVQNVDVELVYDCEQIEGNLKDVDPKFVVNDRDTNVQSLRKGTNNVPPNFPFSGREKINIQTSDPIQVFSSIIDDGLLDKIVAWTNKRAAAIRGNPQPKNATLNKWIDVSREELKKFLGLSMLMGNVNLPSFKHFWSTDPLYEHPIFGKTMSRNRYECILQCLCFYDAESDRTDRKMHKIDRVHNHILINCNNIYSPGKFLSLDEAIVLFRGRLSFRQYLKNKSHKRGINLYELCTSDGFILNILIHEGKGTLLDEGKRRTYEVVMKLLENFIDTGRTVNSVDHAENLLKNRTNKCGTIQGGRAYNPQVVETKSKRGQKGDVIMKWRDKRNVLTISTPNVPEMEKITNRRGNVIRKPSTVVSCNKGTSRIDRSDQMSYCSTPRKSLRWYIKIFFRLMDVALWNGAYIFSRQTAKTNYLEFRDLVIKNYIQAQPVRSPHRTIAKSTAIHLPIKLPKRLRCYVCRVVHRKRSGSFFACSICKDPKNKAFGLCMPTCFNHYHEKDSSAATTSKSVPYHRTISPTKTDPLATHHEIPKTVIKEEVDADDFDDTYSSQSGDGEQMEYVNCLSDQGELEDPLSEKQHGREGQFTNTAHSQSFPSVLEVADSLAQDIENILNDDLFKFGAVNPIKPRVQPPPIPGMKQEPTLTELKSKCALVELKLRMHYLKTLIQNEEEIGSLKKEACKLQITKEQLEINNMRESHLQKMENLKLEQEFWKLQLKNKMK